MDLISKFIEYCQIWTTSNEENETSCPSSENQLVLLNKLKDELIELGLNVTMDEYGRVYGHLDGNKKFDCIGLCAHVDTASECSGKDVKPQIIKNYDGKDIAIGNGYVMSPNDFPELLHFVGKTLITTDGSTLLGADDKAGVAIIMKLLSELVKVEKNNRRPISVLFTPDEEIGRGPEHFNVKKFNCSFAYTIDGGDIHEISYENFNASSCKIEVDGISIHPGDAKDKMVNACLVLKDFMDALPQEKIPAKTENYEGFNHILGFSGNVEHAEAMYIIRNHDRAKLDEQKQEFVNAKNVIENKYPKATIKITIEDQYRNMKEVIDQHPNVLAEIENAFRLANKEFFYVPTRGGTDGATFSFMGCPCPNLGTGSRNHHGRFEYAIVDEMIEMIEVLKRLFIIA